MEVFFVSILFILSVAFVVRKLFFTTNQNACGGCAKCPTAQELKTNKL